MVGWKKIGSLFFGAVALATALIPGVALAAGESTAGFPPPRVRPFLEEYCYDCHGRGKQRGDVDLERISGETNVAADRDVWEKIREVLDSHDMPPEKKPQPTETARRTAVDQILTVLDRFDASAPSNPGVVTLRRLNRNEYRNTIRDLLGVAYDTRAEFPADESGYGFDNIGDVLSLPPMLLEKYLAAAEEITSRVIVTEDPALKRVHRIPPDRFTPHGDSISLEDGTWGFFREGDIRTDYAFPKAGDYLLRLTAYGEQAGSELPRMGVRLDDRGIHEQSVSALNVRPESFEVPVKVDAGTHHLAVSYLNNFNKDGDRNVFLVSLEIVGPLGVAAEEYPEPHRRILPHRPEKGSELAYATDVLGRLARRAYRRPVTGEEVARLVHFVDIALKDGASFERGIQLALEAMLVSPYFLYRWELDPRDLAPGAVRDLNDFEIASRLSYFLWSSMPDEGLFAAAERGDLHQPDVLGAEVRRMLRDPRAHALVRNFGGQWLQFRNLDQVEPDTTVFPTWNRELRDDMRQEAEMFLWAIIQEDHDIRDLIDAPFTYLNERLARHYGIPGVEGEDFRRVDLPPGSGRGGVLTLGSVLTVTSVPTRTAPVLRGKWILEQVLGAPPPPPPPNVPPLETGEEAARTASLRQRLELHRSKPDCMVCHQKMDPLGFALENFDAIGAWRDKDGPHPIDNAAELPNGRKFQGAAGLKAVLRGNPEFPRAFVSKLLTYALGRGLEPYDRATVRGILEDLAKNDFKFSRLVLDIVSSEPFLKRKPRPAIHEQQTSIDSSKDIPAGPRRAGGVAGL